ncbi:hypothetical protein B0H10DRAFT_1970803 [Mycena sp. CBHHK59/15]|nr:hypothetical protein B0H10DRAFT_1973653 [Mycena sp. CBHHK59/15]KAJ6541272.1 hypothetical protein B0H10DRAFT_1970803 [Mycena sp. CBHHK59/15]
MSQRERREASTAHPGNIIIKAKQKCCTREEINCDNLAKQQAKDEKQRRVTEKRQAGVQRVAAMEEQLRAEDEHACAVAAHPDITTTALNPPSTPGPATTVDMDTDMDDPDDNAGSDDGGLDPMDNGDDSEKDPSFEGEEEPDGGEGKDKEERGKEADDDEDDDIQAKIAAFEKSLHAKKKGKGSEKNASKLQKAYCAPIGDIWMPGNTCSSDPQAFLGMFLTSVPHPTLRLFDGTEVPQTGWSIGTSADRSKYGSVWIGDYHPNNRHFCLLCRHPPQTQLLFILTSTLSKVGVRE